ncbi:MAG: L-rhamnose isomerase [Bacillota bacterium]
MNEKTILQGYEYAKEVYAVHGIDTNAAIKKADDIPLTLHSWQGDDLIGFDGIGTLTGGISATGNYPGRARTADELRMDITEAVSMIPGKLRVGLHSCHAELNGKKVDRDAYTIEFFQNWVDWAKEHSLQLDFNPTFFSHPKMDGNFSLASAEEGIRAFWIEHGKRCREIGAEFGKQLGTPCITNFWMPDGYKDIPADTSAPRHRMMDSLDKIFSEKIDPALEMDSLESKLFGLGIESYTVVSHEFALGYCLKNKKLLCLDTGHFHPTESVGAKLTAIVPFLEGVMLHVSRGIRWDSDHVVIWDDELQNIMNEIIHNGYEDKVHIGMDFFDASINRIAAWTIGTRNTRKALLNACLTPFKDKRAAESEGDFTTRLALHEENKSLPFSAVWDYYCLTSGVPVGREWIGQVKKYEHEVLSKR